MSKIYMVSGLYAHENLTLFIIHAEDALRSGGFLTLEEAMGQVKFFVRETDGPEAKIQVPSELHKRCRLQGGSCYAKVFFILLIVLSTGARIFR